MVELLSRYTPVCLRGHLVRHQVQAIKTTKAAAAAVVAAADTGNDNDDEEEEQND